MKIYDNKRWNLWDRLYWFFRYGLFNYLSELKYKVPNTFQRARRGWGFADTWSLDYYLAKVIRDSIFYLKENKLSIPTNLSDEDNFEFNEKLWNSILDDIIWTFDMALKIIDLDVFFPPSEKEWEQEWYNKETKFLETLKNKDYMPRAATKEEVEKYNKGWKYFQEYFLSLWD